MVIQGKIFEYAMEVVLTESRRRLHTYLQTSEHTLTECLLPTDGAILKTGVLVTDALPCT